VVVLILGGSRSGKSEVAEQVVARLVPPVTYVATADAGDGVDVDADFAARIARHRARRPVEWSTVEVGVDLPDVLRALSGSVLVDALGTWLARHSGFEADVDGLCDALRVRRGASVVVSDEVGLGVHPSTEAGRRFRDALGTANQAVATVADRVLLVVAGRVLDLPRAVDLPGLVDLPGAVDLPGW
jgi:adenosylcobinamide kinase/adenosylcobinamide-phosphate guanylyltransferase